MVSSLTGWKKWKSEPWMKSWRRRAIPKLDFVSIDVEGLELQVLRGFDLARHRPAVLLIEDHLKQLDVHRHLARHGYRVVKRTGVNNWYVPKRQPFHMTTWTERLKLFRKMYLGLPFRKMRWSRRRRKDSTPLAT